MKRNAADGLFTKPSKMNEYQHQIIARIPTLEEYIKENPMAVDVISGPQLLDWPREKHSMI